MPWGVAAAGISVAGSAASASSAKSANRSARRRGKTLINRFERRQDTLMDQKLGGLYDSKDALSEGYDQSRAELAKADYGMRSRVFEENKQLQGQLASRDVASGNFSGSASANRYRGLSDRTQRKLLDVDATVGRMFAGLAERRGAAMGVAEQNIANFYGQRRDAEYQTFGNRLDAFGIGGARAQGTSMDLGGLGMMFKDLFGNFGDKGTPAVGEAGSLHAGPPSSLAPK
jgi:hypothetical protein